VFLFLLILVSSITVTKASAWSNGGYSSDSSNPDYGTHDWIAQHALDWLPDAEKRYLTDNIVTYLYGTELPDNGGAADGIGDSINHHFYYSSSGVVTDDIAAVRASEVYGEALNFLVASDFVNAAKHAGIMTHYIADIAVFGHVMGSGTEWGAEQHHSDYETYVNQKTSSYNAAFNSYLSFDGALVTISAYDATKDLAYDTTFDVNGDRTCVWMDQNYDWSNPIFRDRCGESLNLAVNYVADVLHTLYIEATTEAKSPSSITCSASPSTTTLGNLVTVSGSISPSHPSVTVSLTYTKPDDTTMTRTATATSTSSYSDTYTPSITGSWTVIASWDGDYDHWGATSSTVSFTVEKEESFITCFVSPSTITVGESITVAGTVISSGIGAVAISLTFTRPDSTTVIRTVETTPTGYYEDTYTPDVVGSWSVIASWGGDSEHEGAESWEVSFTVGKKESSIACSVSQQSITVGSSVTISGSIAPSHPASVIIKISIDGGTSWNALATVTSASDGKYSHSWMPLTAGTYLIKASWPGDIDHAGAESSTASLIVEEQPQAPSQISCGLSSNSTILGSSVTISSSIEPTHSGVVITIYYRLDGGTWNNLASGTTNSSGAYSYSWIVPSNGTYYLKVSWPGDDDHLGAESEAISLIVKKAEELSFACLEELFIIDGRFTASFGYGAEANTVDTVGGTLVSAWFSSYAPRGTNIDVLMDNTITSVSEVSGPLIAVGGPEVNLFWSEYNTRTFGHFTISGTDWTVVVGSNEYHKEGNYDYEGGSKTDIITDYAIVELLWDKENNRPVLLIAGISGHATKAACEWFCNNADNIITEESHAFILEIKNYGNGIWISTTVSYTV